MKVYRGTEKARLISPSQTGRREGASHLKGQLPELDLARGVISPPEEFLENFCIEQM